MVGSHIVSILTKQSNGDNFTNIRNANVETTIVPTMTAVSWNGTICCKPHLTVVSRLCMLPVPCRDLQEETTAVTTDVLHPSTQPRIRQGLV